MLAGAVPEELRALILPHIENHDLTFWASITCGRELVVKAFLNDPNVKAKCTDEAAVRGLVDDMIAGTAKYLPEGWRK